MALPSPLTLLSKRRRRLFQATIGLLGFALSLLTSEVMLRLRGHEPWRDVGYIAREPIMFQPDPELGWVNKEGSYVVPPYAEGAPPIRMTFLRDGSRLTDAGVHDGKREVILVGDSFTQGWAVSDDETFSWRIQERFPALRIVNYGTGGYSTYQSLLLLEKLLREPDPGQAVFYGFTGAQERRNVAEPEWLRALAAHSRRGTVASPYCTLGPAAALERHPPRAYAAWPLRRWLATAAFLELAHARWTGRERVSQARRVTELLVLEMNELCKTHAARFSVILLSLGGERKIHYVQFLRSQGIDFVDCTHRLTPDLRVVGEGHPNAKLHARWADCIAQELEQSTPGPGSRALGGEARPAGPSSGWRTQHLAEERAPGPGAR